MLFLIMLFLIFFVIVVLCFFLLKQHRKIREIEQKLQEFIPIVENLEHSQQSDKAQLQKQTKKITSYESILMTTQQTFENKLAQSLKMITQLQHDLTDLNNQSPQDKLYSRAFKLAALGADVNEISQTCEIPLAEAEILLSIHQNK